MTADGIDHGPESTILKCDRCGHNWDHAHVGKVYMAQSGGDARCTTAGTSCEVCGGRSQGTIREIYRHTGQPVERLETP